MDSVVANGEYIFLVSGLLWQVKSKEGDRKMKKARGIILSLLCLLWLPYFMAAWDKDKPSSSTSLRSSNPEILANQSALETAFGQDHEFATGDTNSGKHEVLVMEEESSAGASSTNEGHLQVIDGGSQPEMAFTSEDGDELQMTKDGDLYSSDGLVVDGTSTFTGAITADINLNANIELITDNAGIRADTVDSDDDQTHHFAGGGSADSSRGGYIKVSGEDDVSTPGDVQIVAGDSGQVDITGDVTRLTVGPSGGTTHILNVYGSVGSGYVARFQNDGDTAGRGGIVIRAGKDDASGTTIYTLMEDGDGGNTVGNISHVSGTLGFVQVSDKRLKENLRDTDIKGIESIKKLRIKDYTKIGDPSVITGMVAQDIAAVIPDAVLVSDDPNEPMSYMRAKIFPYLIKAQQEFDARIDALAIRMGIDPNSI